MNSRLSRTSTWRCGCGKRWRLNNRLNRVSRALSVGAICPRASSSLASAAGPLLPRRSTLSILAQRRSSVVRRRRNAESTASLEPCCGQDGTNVEQRAGRSGRGDRADSHDIAREQVRGLVDAGPLTGNPVRGGRYLDDLARVALDSMEHQCAPMRSCSRCPQASCQEVLRPRLRGGGNSINAGEQRN